MCIRDRFVTDAMLKAAKVNLVIASSLCPGKYLTIVEGETGAVENSLRIAEELGGMHVFSSEVVNSVNMKVIHAIYGKFNNDKISINSSIAIIESRCV